MNLRPLSALAALSLVTLFGAPAAQAQTHSINTATDLFSLSFRDAGDADAGLTTYFGWGSGSFDGPTDNELIDLPPITISLGGVNGTLSQLGLADILAGSNNIYNGTLNRTETVRIAVPTLGGGASTGFTTLIIQGLTSSGMGTPAGLIASYPDFQPINGVPAKFTIGVNGANTGQWFAKYELPGNQASYNVDFTITNTGGPTQPVTISKLTADSKYSTTAYAPDIAVVPEPATGGLLLAGLLGALARRRRANRAS